MTKSKTNEPPGKTSKSGGAAVGGKSMEDRLYGIADLQSGTFEFGGMMPNAASSFATRFLEELLDNRKESAAGFIGLGGYIEFPGRAFPEDREKLVEQQLGEMLAELDAGRDEAGRDDIITKRYTLILIHADDRAKVVSRIEAIERERQGRIRRQLDSRTDKRAYDGVAKDIEVRTHAFRRQVAADLLPALKSEMRRRNPGTYEEKKDLVRWVNAELERFGFAIKFPKSGQPSTLKAKQGNHPEIGRFQLICEDDSGKEKTFNPPELDTLLEDFDLVDAPPRREALAEFHKRGPIKRGGTARG